MPTTDELLEKLLATAREQLRWQRAFVLPHVRQTLEGTLTTSQLRLAYEMCDGTKQSADIAAAVGTSKQSMSNWTRRWRDLGIAYEVDGRKVRHLTSLSALGISIEIEGEGRPTKAVKGKTRRNGN